MKKKKKKKSKWMNVKNLFSYLKKLKRIFYPGNCDWLNKMSSCLTYTVYTGINGIKYSYTVGNPVPETQEIFLERETESKDIEDEFKREHDK